MICIKDANTGDSEGDSIGAITIARYIIIGELRFFFRSAGIERMSRPCMPSVGNNLHNPDLVGPRGIMVL